METKTRPISELFEALTVLTEDFLEDAGLQLEKGNKAAGRRSRITSLNLERLLKEWRKASLEASK